MPTPQRIRDAALAKRKRTCVVCGTVFYVKKSSQVGRTCSKEHHRIHLSRLKTGTKQSPETIAKRSRSLEKAWADPGRRERWRSAVGDGIRRWHEDEDNARSFANRSSKRMKERHADPEWQKTRNNRSSRTMKENWAKHRDLFVTQACERYARGIGIASKESIQRKNQASKWIMKRAQEALHAETDYDAVFSRVQERFRNELPYDVEVHGDYTDYSRIIGEKVVNSIECRTIADGFLARAIPRFSSEWQENKGNASVHPH